MADNFSPEQAKVMAAMRSGRSWLYDRDNSFYSVITMVTSSMRMNNIIKCSIPNLEVLLKVDAEVLMSIPNCGKKTANEILELQAALLGSKVLLGQLKDAIEADRKFQAYKTEHAEVLGGFFELRDNNAYMLSRFEDRLKYEVKKGQTHDGSPLG